MAPTSVAAGTVETVEVAGTTFLVLGQVGFLSLSGGPGTLTTAADTLTYVAVKGATTARYYGVAFLGQAISSAFTVPANEKLNIVVRNQDTAAHAFSGYWHALTS